MNKTKTFEPNKVAEACGLTEQQQKFADYYLFVTGLNGEKAAELAGYVICDPKKYEQSEEKIAYWTKIQYMKIARDLLNNPKVLEYINIVRTNMENQLVIDKLWVVKKLKEFAETGSERTQLEATKLLGQTLLMFTEVVRNENSTEDPAKIIQDAIAKRKEEVKENNVLEFQKVKNGN